MRSRLKIAGMDIYESGASLVSIGARVSRFVPSANWEPHDMNLVPGERELCLGRFGALLDSCDTGAP